MRPVAWLGSSHKTGATSNTSLFPRLARAAQKPSSPYFSILIKGSSEYTHRATGTVCMSSVCLLGTEIRPLTGLTGVSRGRPHTIA